MKKIFMVLIGVMALTFMGGGRAVAADCRDVEFVFARGSGAERSASAE